MFTRKTALIQNENSIAKLKAITIGGVQQWITVRGEDKRMPVLLFLHGGPGTSQMALIGDYQKELEKHFVVVNWDQRGAGLSYTKQVTKETMTIEQFLKDTIELTNYLRNEFLQDKIYLVGHSWGTILGLLAINDHPELYHHYFGVSQVLNMSKIEELSYRLILEKARKHNHQKAITQLTEMGKPPWSSFKNNRIYQKYLEVFKSGISRDGVLLKTFVKKMFKSSEYTFWDMIRFIRGQYFSNKNLMDEVRSLDLSEMIRFVKVPITLMMGRHDLATPAELTKIWFDRLKAAEKDWVWFERSAHSPLFEENQKFIELVLAQTERR
ncbi:alpha/beta hydrolase [Psychrobacillus glaciei]|uniref:Alpha/beta hydrolase n=1 Tax=Psychrobacillus glaciei TaxID=2283160 RepID=A0A5J6SNS7_9BACI|nr:alpha/beta hydrolase [Psychrobacillus glaciei]QFF98414.1 alpha/beta hydrolase [Psychrobacillus glaciei]